MTVIKEAKRAFYDLQTVEGTLARELRSLRSPSARGTLWNAAFLVQTYTPWHKVLLEVSRTLGPPTMPRVNVIFTSALYTVQENTQQAAFALAALLNDARALGGSTSTMSSGTTMPTAQLQQHLSVAHRHVQAAIAALE